MPEDMNGFVPTFHLFHYRDRLPGPTQQEHISLYNDLVYVVKGKVNYVVDHQVIHLTEGDLGYFPKDRLKRAHADPNGSFQCYSLIFLYDFLEGNPVELPLPMRIKSKSVDSMVTRWEHLREIWTTKQPGYLLQSRAVVMLLIFELLKFSLTKTEPPSDNMSKVKRYIANHYNQRLTVDELASLLKLNPVYFGSLFKKNTGLSVKEFINRVRIENAKLLLGKGIFNVSEVAELCGFQDIFYFSKVFKYVTGIPPSEYRRQNNY
jgi:AraC-like DNA-binding protein